MSVEAPIGKKQFDLRQFFFAIFYNNKNASQLFVVLGNK
jgi:hypothetical protein